MVEVLTCNRSWL